MYFTSRIRCGNCGKYRTVRGSVALHKTRTAFEQFLRENGVSPCPCRLNHGTICGLSREFISAATEGGK